MATASVEWLKEAAAALDADIFVPGHSSFPADPKQEDKAKPFVRRRGFLEILTRAGRRGPVLSSN
jgi:hypothetical protein